MRPILAMPWDANERLNLAINVEYSFTPRDEGSGDVRALELKLPFATKFTDRWSGSLTYKRRWDFEADDRRHRAETGASFSWGGVRQYALNLGICRTAHKHKTPYRPRDEHSRYRRSLLHSNASIVDRYLK